MLTSLPEWESLEAHAASLADHDLRALFAADPRRADRMHVEAGGWFLDYAKQRVNSETMRLLVQLAVARGWRARVDATFAGEHVNVSENRPCVTLAPAGPVGPGVPSLDPHAARTSARTRARLRDTLA